VLLKIQKSDESTELDTVEDPIGLRNDEILEHLTAKADLVVGAWDSPGDWHGCPVEVLQSLDTDIHALTVLSSRNPGHPLYKSRGLEPTPYEYDD